MMMNDNKPRFTSILVARANNARPSELEVQLRQHCQKMRVHAQLSGAHMIFPQEHGFAVRCYYASDMDKLKDNDDDDGIVAFSKQFQWSVVFFVVPDNKMLNNDKNSFVHRSMKHCDKVRMLVLADTSQVIVALTVFADAIAPARRKLREEFCLRTRINCICNDSADTADAAEKLDEAAETLVISAVNAWGERSNIPLAEASILLNLLGNLSSFATANDTVLEGVPVDAQTKKVLQEFFSEEEPDKDAPTMFDNSLATSEPVINSTTPFSSALASGSNIGGGDMFGPEEQPPFDNNENNSFYYEGPPPPPLPQQQPPYPHYSQPPPYHPQQHGYSQQRPAQATRPYPQYRTSLHPSRPVPWGQPRQPRPAGASPAGTAAYNSGGYPPPSQNQQQTLRRYPASGRATNTSMRQFL